MAAYNTNIGKLEISNQVSISYCFELASESNELFIFAHGAGAAYNHKWMENMSGLLVQNGISVFRFNLPYMENGGRPGNALKDAKAISEVFNYLKKLYPHNSIFVGGKSYGGRMASIAAAEGLIDEAKGLIYFGFPLHRPGTPSVDRVAHFNKITQPMYFIQGEKDALANLDFLLPVIDKLGSEYHIENFADHSLKVPKKSGKDQNVVFKEVAKKAADWMRLKI